MYVYLAHDGWRVCPCGDMMFTCLTYMTGSRYKNGLH